MTFDQKAYAHAWYLAHRTERAEVHRAYNFEYNRRYRAKEHPEADARREAHRLEQIAYRRRHREKLTARGKLARAVVAGRIVREPCMTCGATPAHGHHHNGYGREHWYDVIWLCSTHHGEAHRIVP